MSAYMERYACLCMLLTFSLYLRFKCLLWHRNLFNSRTTRQVPSPLTSLLKPYTWSYYVALKFRLADHGQQHAMASEDGSSFNCGSLTIKTFLATFYFAIPFDTLEAVILDLYSSMTITTIYAISSYKKRICYPAGVMANQTTCCLSTLSTTSLKGQAGQQNSIDPLEDGVTSQHPFQNIRMTMLDLWTLTTPDELERRCWSSSGQSPLSSSGIQVDIDGDAAVERGADCQYNCTHIYCLVRPPTSLLVAWTWGIFSYQMLVSKPFGMMTNTPEWCLGIADMHALKHGSEAATAWLSV